LETTLATILVGALPGTRQPAIGRLEEPVRDYVLLWLGLTVGNFLYQWITTHNWSTAVERSFFQGATLFAAWLFIERNR
jgi:hypothetical protein